MVVSDVTVHVTCTFSLSSTFLSAVLQSPCKRCNHNRTREKKVTVKKKKIRKGKGDEQLAAG